MDDVYIVYNVYNVYIAPILPLYIFTCPSNNLRWLCRKLVYLCTKPSCRISIAFLIYFLKLFCMVSILIFLSTWFSTNLWGCIVHYMKLVLLLLKQSQAKSFCLWSCFMLHTLITSNFGKKIFRSNLKLTLLRNLFTLPCSLYFSLFLASPDELFLLWDLPD